MLTKLSPLHGDMSLPVIDATAARMDGIVLFGGMTADFKATPAIQIRNRRGIWQPVGTQMIEARIEPDVVVLSPSEAFVFGGYGGSANGTLKQRVDGELLKPRVAGSSRRIKPPSGSDWKAPSAPVLLKDGTIAILAQGALHRLDPATASWLHPIDLGGKLAGSAICMLHDGRVLACGVDPETDTTIVLEVEPITGIITPWESKIEEPILGARLLLMHDERVMLMGWPEKTGLPSRRTFILDTESRGSSKGPVIPEQPFKTDWMGLRKVHRGIVILLAERSNTGRPRPSIGYLLRMDTAGSCTLWNLSRLPEARRQMLLEHDSGGVVLIGGLATKLGRPKLLTTSIVLTYGTGPSGD